MNVYSLINDNTLCCNKKKVKLIVYNWNGAHVTDRFCQVMCIQIFITQMVVFDILVWKQIISVLLYSYLNDLIPVPMVNFIVHSIQIMFLVSLCGEAKLLVNSLKCKCNDEITYT